MCNVSSVVFQEELNDEYLVHHAKHQELNKALVALEYVNATCTCTCMLHVDTTDTYTCMLHVAHMLQAVFYTL